MKKIITLLLLFITHINYSQESLSIKELENEIKLLKIEIDSIKLDKTSIYNFKNEQIRRGYQIQEIGDKVDQIHDDKIDWFLQYFQFWASLGAILTGLGVWFYNKNNIKTKIAEQIAKLTQTNINFLAKNIEEFEKHTNLKKETKILILNKTGTNFHDGFKKVMNLYKVNLKTDIININDLDEALSNTIINQIRQSDLIIIENQVEKQNKDNMHWIIQTKERCNSIQDFEKNSQIGTQFERQPYQNNLSFITLANKICDTTSIIYYGQQGKGFFPSNFVNSDKQHNVSFASAPSQLYGNVLNMLKFKDELENA